MARDTGPVGTPYQVDMSPHRAEMEKSGSPSRRGGTGKPSYNPGRGKGDPKTTGLKARHG